MTTIVSLQAVSRQLCWWLLLACLFVATSCLSWHLLAKINYGYSWFYAPVGVAENVAEFGPQNRFRQGFERTDRTEHLRLFEAIVHSINDQGKGLAQIRYRLADGRELDTLLHQAEVVHLQDVARLVTHFNFAAVIGGLCAAVLAGVIFWRRIDRPNGRALVLTTVALVLLLAAVLVIVGPIDVFYALHDWVFPAGHQWFFYYQESLMTTLMKAPDIFGYIAALWLFTTLIIYALMCRLLWFWHP